MSEKGLVYIIDDDDAVRDSLELLLSAAGYETRTFASADAFLASPRADGRACLLSDIRMPGMGGIELLETVALNQAVAFLPASTAARNSRADLVYRPVTDLSPSIVAVAWQQGSRSPAIAAFVRAAVEIAERNTEAFTVAGP